MGTVVFAIHSPTQVGCASRDPKEEKKEMENNRRNDMKIPVKFQMSVTSLIKDYLKPLALILINGYKNE
jgi:hypothetical protein